MTHIHFCIIVLLFLGALAVLTFDPYVTFMFSILTLAFTVAFLIHYT
jgi:hypothetical protein|tara:strand:- start:636 stop:776 length:141 start_codon:yes stop_codon:yes gene_type:complete